ncbi:hypothetical protein [Kitasatospora sp. NPDC059327]|uniref:effector-associated domain 2-containing protein n=1 Tax=Kitasatospora sp. NPDC059327 TaxID=3346803 RepID=UPI0036A7A85D
MTGGRPSGAPVSTAAAVEVRDDSGFLGSGFLLSPTVVLTAAHVARRGRAGLGVRGRCGHAGAAGPARLFPVEPGDGRFHAYPDLALLDLDGPVATVPLLLDAGRAPATGTAVLVSGFSTHTPVPGVHGDSLLLTVAGPSAGYLRLTGDEVKDGFSGSMVVRLDSGAICGVLKGSRDFDGVRGGWFTPLAALAAVLPATDPLHGALAGGPGATAGSGTTHTGTTHTGPAHTGTTHTGPAPHRVTPAHRARPLPGVRELVPLLLAVPDMDDPDFRRQVLRAAGERLGPAEPLRVAHRAQAVDHLMELVQACARHRDPATALAAVLDALDFLRPGLAAVDELRALTGLPPTGSDDPEGGPW